MASQVRKSPKGQKRAVIFRAWKTLKDGTKIYAKDYGYKAWPIGSAK